MGYPRRGFGSLGLRVRGLAHPRAALFLARETMSWVREPLWAPTKVKLPFSEAVIDRTVGAVFGPAAGLLACPGGLRVRVMGRGICW